MASEKITLTKIIDPKDDIDTEIVHSTINMIMGLSMGNNFPFSDKKEWEKYFGYILELTQSLLKANSHYRKYVTTEKQVKFEFFEESLKNHSSVDHLKSMELESEVDAILANIKSALDSLAKSFGPILGIKFHGWHKEKKISGGQVIKTLHNNTPKQYKEKTEILIKYIESNISWITYVVFLRDSGSHNGGIKNITNIKFIDSTKEIISQKIIHNDLSEECLLDFMNRLIKEIIEFINSCIRISLLIRVPGNSMSITKNLKLDDYPPYRWVMYKQ